MVKSLLGFARQSPVEEREVDLNEVLTESKRILERTTLAKVKVQLELKRDLWLIRGDSSSLNHALMNLCINAVDAMTENGTLVLSSKNLDDDWVEIRVQDNGHGMSKEVLAKALDPFFTTKLAGKGTGLGLSLVYSTVTAHRGQFDIESVVGQGTTIILRFPKAKPSDFPLGSIRPWKCTSSEKQLNVLLVDDDELAQNAGKRMINRLGHRVRIASTGEETLQILQGGYPADVVILDVNMPGMGGLNTLPDIHHQWPKLPILLATGRPDQITPEVLAKYPMVTPLSKPFGIDELCQKLAPILARSNSHVRDNW
jgi:CheY-like chemotaxis protein/anti-sigma regulatory factor (Ser/Thr protein kinase)